MAAAAAFEKNGDDDDDFYENIEAPKFVDLRAPDRHHPDSDDRYWFCLRLGCDQKHEEEMDSEAIYKNFLLRVMAARSPSVRLRKAALCKNIDSLKCPRTVPAKASKSRISKLAIISHNMLDANKNKPATPLSRHNATPTKKLKQPKAMTTPRNNRRRISNPRTFTGVRALKPPAFDDVPNSRVVAKALVFHSPNKPVLKLKKSIELSSSLRKVCSGMKRLEITNGKKDHEASSQLKKDVCRKQQPRGREVKSRVYSSLRSQKQESQETKQSIHIKPKNKDQQTEESAEEGKEDCLENVGGTLRDQHKSSTLSEQYVASPLDLRKMTESDQAVEMASASDGGELMDKKKLMDMDDKENASGYDENRNINSHANKSALKKKVIVDHEGSRSTTTQKEDTETRSRTVKDDDPCVNGSTLGQGTTKYTKPKTTNPRPFRLRTDERQILKEAKLEKKQQLSVPVKEETRIPVSISRQQEKLKKTRVQFLGQTGTAESDHTATDHHSQPQRGPKSTKVVRPQRVASPKKKKKKKKKLEAIKENSPASLKPTRASPQLTKHTTPKEPKFHSIHTPKSCTRRVATSPTPKRPKVS